MSCALTDIFKVLSDEKRLKIVKALANQSVCANQLLEGLDISQPNLSHHMKVLTDIGLVRAKKMRTQVYYELNREQIKCLCCFVREISGTEKTCLHQSTQANEETE